MKCEKAQEVFSEYMEGTLERPMAFTVEHHLKECPACEHDFERFRATWDMLEDLPEVEVPAGFRAAVMEQIEAQQAARRSRWSLDLRGIFAAKIQVRAVAFVAAAGLFAGLLAFTKVSPWATYNAGPGMSIPRTTQIGPGNDYLDQSIGKQFDSGADIAVSARPNGGKIIYTMNLKPRDGAAGKVWAYLMSSSAPDFTNQAVKSANLIFNQTLGGEAGGSTSVVVQRNAGPQIVFVQWEYQSIPVPEATAVFLPSSLSQSRTAVRDFSAGSISIHEAVQRLSETYGVVVIMDSRINGRCDSVDLKSKNVDDAFFSVLKDQGLRSTSVARNVFVVERKQ